MRSIYIYGASGHGLVVADIAASCGFEEIIYIDDGQNIYPSFEEIEDTKIPLVFGVGNNFIRKKLFYKVKAKGFSIITLIDPTASISRSATIGEGTVIMPRVVVNAKTIIGNGVIVNSSSVIEHENIVEDFSHISPAVALAGDVKIGENSHIGIGTVVIQGLRVGKNSKIGAGSIVTKSIGDNKLCYGNPCKVIKDLDG